jgi:hypothetical protein
MIFQGIDVGRGGGVGHRLPGGGAQRGDPAAVAIRELDLLY